MEYTKGIVYIGVYKLMPIIGPKGVVIHQPPDEWNWRYLPHDYICTSNSNIGYFVDATPNLDSLHPLDYSLISAHRIDLQAANWSFESKKMLCIADSLSIESIQIRHCKWGYITVCYKVTDFNHEQFVTISVRRLARAQGPQPNGWHIVNRGIGDSAGITHGPNGDVMQESIANKCVILHALRDAPIDLDVKDSMAIRPQEPFIKDVTDELQYGDYLKQNRPALFANFVDKRKFATQLPEAPHLGALLYTYAVGIVNGFDRASGTVRDYEDIVITRIAKITPPIHYFGLVATEFDPISAIGMIENQGIMPTTGKAIQGIASSNCMWCGNVGAIYKCHVCKHPDLHFCNTECLAHASLSNQHACWSQ
jgi:hypothetical protein